jgi:hypothetical protein
MISPGIIFTPLAKDELTGPRREAYRRIIELCPVGRGGTPDEVGTVGALLMGPEGGFITGSDFLMDGGVTAAYRFGDLAPKWAKLSRHQHAFKGNLMEYHILGRTGVSVRTCALGAMMFGPWGDPRP